MTLNENDKSELVAAAGLAIDLDEPEGFIEALRRVALKKAETERLSDHERARWRLVAQALVNAQQTIEGAPTAPNDAQAAPAAPQDAVGDKIAEHRP
jgi:2-hydroxychromene-2-carboxylate isomerase